VSLAYLRVLQLDEPPVRVLLALEHHVDRQQRIEGISDRFLALEKMGSEHNTCTANGSAMRDRLSIFQDPIWDLSFVEPLTGFHAASSDASPAVQPGS
jgi:hypothetical protein